MTEENYRETWFPRKKFGIGWGFPVTRAGWVFFIGWSLVTVFGCYYFQGEEQVPLLLGFMLLMTLLLLLVCYFKGEKLNPP